MILVRQYIFWIDVFDPARKRWSNKIMSFVRRLSKAEVETARNACILEARRLMPGYKIRCKMEVK